MYAKIQVTAVRKITNWKSHSKHHVLEVFNDEKRFMRGSVLKMIDFCQENQLIVDFLNTSTKER